jgi:SMI1 / KNR4 family (SUKH-1)
MSSLHPTLLILALLAPIAALILWRVFVRKDPAPAAEIAPEPINLLSASDVEAIEVALGVALPADYVRFLQTERPQAIDETTVRDDAELIIGCTHDYRDSNQWPAHLVWIGDEEDGCPYVLDCISGEVFRLQKGNLRKAWDKHPSFSAFVAAKLRQWAQTP